MEKAFRGVNREYHSGVVAAPPVEPAHVIIEHALKRLSTTEDRSRRHLGIRGNVDWTGSYVSGTGCCSAKNLPVTTESTNTSGIKFRTSTSQLKKSDEISSTGKR